MLERPTGGDRAILVHLTLSHFKDQAPLAEFEQLVRSAGAVVVAQVTGMRAVPDAAFFIGSGKVEEIAALVPIHQVDVVLFNHSLSPAQERNLERAFQCRVLDRTGVILDIFAQRARTFEGKLQVELAQLQHLSTRLVRGWTHLERQKGGIGLRGPGETQLETDRRLLGERIKAIHKRLEKVTQQRELSRRARRRAELPVISLVGYTNAGKSTLFNRLTESTVYVADQLFATLDATLRRLDLPNKIPVVIADTVGFIQQLPHDLVAAFRATLEETRQATLLLHIVDASDEQRADRIAQVNQVLAEIEAQDVPQLLIYNKIDNLTSETPRCERDATGHITKIWLSARTGAGVDLLTAALAEQFSHDLTQCWVKIPGSAGQLRARLFTLGTVVQERFTEDGDNVLELVLPARQLQHLLETESQLQVIKPLASLAQAS